VGKNALRSATGASLLRKRPNVFRYRQRKTMKRLLGIVHISRVSEQVGSTDELYGLSGVRTPEKIL
jgi:hypothetical protein